MSVFTFPYSDVIAMIVPLISAVTGRVTNIRMSARLKRSMLVSVFLRTWMDAGL
jgi:hypothetical protein